MKIFLDIDGVMVHANPSRKLDFEDDGFYRFNVEAVSAINTLDNENNELILSTSHRFRYSIDEWKSIFTKRGLHFRDISRIDIGLEKNHSRKLEIESWINLQNFQPEDFLIIDDDKSLNGLNEKYKSRLVLTSPYIGLNSSQNLADFQTP